MSMMEFTTAVRNRLPLVVVVLNDGAYGAEYKKMQQLGIDPANSCYAWPEFSDLAQAMGGFGLTVRTSSDLSTVAKHIEARQFPLVVDVKADPAAPLGELA
jgi:thiamine pyrophosphate-dependent acetolactate synthase large subunit-like protein